MRGAGGNTVWPPRGVMLRVPTVLGWSGERKGIRGERKSAGGRMDGGTDVLGGARWAPAQPVVTLQREEASSLLPTPRKSGFDFPQPPKPSVPGTGARLHAPPSLGSTEQGPPAFVPALPPPRCLPCPAVLPQLRRLPASNGRGGHGGVTSSLNRRFLTALGTASGASSPAPASSSSSSSSQRNPNQRHGASSLRAGES